MQGTDIIGQARTGTGKTLAFGIGLVQRIMLPGDDGWDQNAAGKPQALILCPTRELALQVGKDLDVVAQARHARVLTVYGGVGYEPQLESLGRGVDVVVGTPGRLLDLANRRELDLTHVKVLVLDEADEMLDLGFLPDVERLISLTPASRQTLLFSATMPAPIVALARTHMTRPLNVRAETDDAQLTVPATTQFVYQAHDLDKPEIIGKLLQSPGCTRAIIFTRTKRSAQRLADELVERGFKATSIHGDLSQIMRERALTRFRDGKVQVLVATDVAARGLDVTDVTHVINYECPDDEKTYIHRIGRTGRAGNTGIAVTLVDWADITRWKVINKALGLDFDEPAETYSTSAHLYQDLEIEPGTKGRVAGPAAPPSPSATGAREAARPRPSRTKTRLRLRNGQPVERPGSERPDQEPSGTEPPSALATATTSQPEDVGTAPDSATFAAGTKPRQRRRRRRVRPEDSDK